MELVNLYMHAYYIIVIGHVSVRCISNYSVLITSCVSVWLYDILHCCCGIYSVVAHCVNLTTRLFTAVVAEDG